MFQLLLGLLMIMFLENRKQGFKRTISWDKFISEITTQPKNANLHI